jgi:hypothetical protein
MNRQPQGLGSKRHWQSIPWDGQSCPSSKNRRTILSVIEESTDRIARPTSKWHDFGTPGLCRDRENSLAEAFRFGDILITAAPQQNQQPLAANASELAEQGAPPCEEQIPNAILPWLPWPG